MSLQVGEIVHLELLLEHRPAKYAVCICVAPNYFFLVNSENRKMYDCIPFPQKAGRKFPHHDSFIGCKNIFTAELKQISSRHGFLDHDELRTILAKVKSSKTIVARDKDKISKAIEEVLNKATTP